MLPTSKYQAHLLAAMFSGVAIVLVAIVVAVATDTVAGVAVAFVLLVAATIGLVAYVNRMITASAERDTVRHAEHDAAVPPGRDPS
jgi:zinc transporter ZupT